MDLHCAPEAHKLGEETGSCFTHGELKLLAKEFNKHSPNKIKVTKQKKELVEELEKAYEKVCDKHQFCWISQHLSNSGKKQKLIEKFRPVKPKTWYQNRGTWLNTYDINYIMMQYENLYKDFKFMGTVPADFAERDQYGNCIGDLLCDFDVHEFKKLGRTRFGMVVNTDTSRGQGSHWRSVYINTNKKKENYGIYYYDSVSTKYDERSKKFFDKVVKQVDDPDFKIHYNHVQRQFLSNECGMFSIVFLTQILKNIPFKEICERMPTDKRINEIRDILYRPNLEVKII
jgi:hypothetical protein